MRVLVDTSVWSLALRRRSAAGADSSEVAELTRLVRANLVDIIGPIRQEVLSGISLPKQFELLRTQLVVFEDLTLGTGHFETAARFSNLCRRKGVQGSHTDFLICAVSRMNRVAIFSRDRDFEHYAKYLPITLHRL